MANKMINIKIYIDYFKDNTCTVKEIYINGIKKAEINQKKMRIDLSVLKPYEGHIVQLIKNIVYDVSKNNTKLYIIKEVRTLDNGEHVVNFEDI